MSVFFLLRTKYSSTPLGSTFAFVRPRPLPILYFSWPLRAFAERQAGVSPPPQSPPCSTYDIYIPGTPRLNQVAPQDERLFRSLTHRSSRHYFRLRMYDTAARRPETRTFRFRRLRQKPKTQNARTKTRSHIIHMYTCKIHKGLRRGGLTSALDPRMPVITYDVGKSKPQMRQYCQGVY